MQLESKDGSVTCVEAGIDPAWDALVEATPGGDLTQTTRWAMSRRRVGFRAYRITIATSGQKLLGGCLMYAKRVTPACWVASIPRGPLLFTTESRAASTVVEGILTSARRGGVRILVIQPPERASALDRAMTEIGFHPGVPSVAPEATIRLDLRCGDEELISAMKATRRRELRKALQAGFDVTQDDDVELFHRLHVATAKRQNFVPASRENLRAQWDSLAPHGNCTMFIARYHGVATAGIWLTRFGGTVTFKLTGWDASSPAPPHANDALHWAAIQWARTNGEHTYDLGSFDRHCAESIICCRPMPDSFHRSPSFYKLSFGGTPALLPCARFLLLPKLADLALSRAAQRMFASAGVRRLAQHLRSGRFPGLQPPQALRRI